MVTVEIRVHQLISITDEEFGDNSRVRSASVNDPFILVILDSGKVVVFETNEKTKDTDIHHNISLIQVCLRKG